MTGLIRIIILGMLLALARNLFLKFQQNRLKQAEKKRSRTEEMVESKKTLRCDHCGVYIPSSEAFSDGEKNFCCPEHKEEHKEQHKEDDQ